MKSYSNQIISREEFDDFKQVNATQNKHINILAVVTAINTIGLVAMGVMLLYLA